MILNHTLQEMQYMLYVLNTLGRCKLCGGLYIRLNAANNFCSEEHQRTHNYIKIKNYKFIDKRIKKLKLKKDKKLN